MISSTVIQNSNEIDFVLNSCFSEFSPAEKHPRHVSWSVSTDLNNVQNMLRCANIEKSAIQIISV